MRAPRMSETLELKQGHFEGWAIVEMMGHRKEIGYVTTEAFGAAVLFRVDQPAMPEGRQVVLEYSRMSGEHYCLPGTKVKYGAVEARTVLVAPGSIYALNPCTEAAARKAIDANIPRPVVLLDVPPQTAITARGTAPPDVDSEGADREP